MSGFDCIDSNLTERRIEEMKGSAQNNSVGRDNSVAKKYENTLKFMTYLKKNRL